MADFSKLNAAIAETQTDFAAYQAAVAASTVNDQPAIDTATAAVTALGTSIKAATAAVPTA